jgi:hypothetical protein
MTMLHNFKVVLREENDLIPLIRFWCKMFSSPIFNDKLLYYIKLVEIATTQVLGLVEDK